MACRCRRCKFDPRVRKSHWSRKWQPSPVFLPGNFHGQRTLASYSPWGHKESDMTEQLSTHTHNGIRQTTIEMIGKIILVQAISPSPVSSHSQMVFTPPVSPVSSPLYARFPSPREFYQECTFLACSLP